MEGYSTTASAEAMQSEEVAQWARNLRIASEDGDAAVVKELLAQAPDKLGTFPLEGNMFNDSTGKGPMQPIIVGTCKGFCKGFCQGKEKGKGKGNYAETVKQLVAAKADVNATCNGGGLVGASASIYGSQLGDPELLKCLLDSRADPNTALTGPDDSEGFVPIMVSALMFAKGEGKGRGQGGRSPYFDCTELLINAHADVNGRVDPKGKGKGVLHVTNVGFRVGHFDLEKDAAEAAEFLQLLFAAGADDEMCDNDGEKGIDKVPREVREMIVREQRSLTFEISVKEDGGASISCTDIGGTEVLTLDVEEGVEDIKKLLWQAVSERLEVPTYQVQLVGPNQTVYKFNHTMPPLKDLCVTSNSS